MPTMKTFERKWILIPLVMALFLSACNATGTTKNTTDQAVSRATVLALGTVALEGTELAVGTAAAAQLLPVWEVFADLKASSTSAPEELAATVEAIEAAMTPDQLAAIEAMDVSAREIEANVPSRSVPAAPAAVRGDTQATSAAIDPALAGELGVGAAGGMPMDGGGPPEGMMPGGGAQTTQAGTRTTIQAAGGVFQTVIELLQSKTQLS